MVLHWKDVTNSHLSEECKRVIAEHAIRAFGGFFPQIEDKDKIISFVEKHRNSSRESLRRESEKFLEKWG